MKKYDKGADCGYCFISKGAEILGIKEAADALNRLAKRVKECEDALALGLECEKAVPDGHAVVELGFVPEEAISAGVKAAEIMRSLDGSLRDQILAAYTDMIIKADVSGSFGLCEDEGCPQHGTDHVCVDYSRSQGPLDCYLMKQAPIPHASAGGLDNDLTALKERFAECHRRLCSPDNCVLDGVDCVWDFDKQGVEDYYNE